MIDPIFYLMLTPLGIAIIVALIVFVRLRRTDSKRAFRLALIIVGVGVIIPIVLFVGFTAFYYSGGGH